MKIFKRENFINIAFSTGESYSLNSDVETVNELWEFANANIDNEEVVYYHVFKTEKIDVLEQRIANSNILVQRGASVYMPEVSELSIPKDFVEKILDAEEEGDEKEVNKYKNFWTLVSLNPDSRVRNNIFWFIRRWDMKISDSGLIIAYRNAVLKSSKYSQEEVKHIINAYYETKYLYKEDPYSVQGNEGKSLGEMYDEVVNGEKSPVYTDQHSHTTEIRLGQPVKMPREECDAEQEHSCSSGLHVGAKGWLQRYYFGDVGLQVLVNPVNIVAVPTIDDYGKMRTCEYLPVALIDFDEDGNVIEPKINLYNDIQYLTTLKYNGNINNKDIDNYEIKGFRDREDVYNSILARLSK